MKRLVLAILLVLLLVPSSSFAWGRGGHWGGAIAAGIFGGFATGILLDRAFAPWPAYYPEPYYPEPYYPSPYYPGGYPYYSYPPPYYQHYQPAPGVAQQPAPVYQQSQSGYWYWCDNPQGYYPYVQNCPSNWKQVVPQTTPPNR